MKVIVIRFVLMCVVGDVLRSVVMVIRCAESCARYRSLIRALFYSVYLFVVVFMMMLLLLMFWKN